MGTYKDRRKGSLQGKTESAYFLHLGALEHHTHTHTLVFFLGPTERDELLECTGSFHLLSHFEEMFTTCCECCWFASDISSTLSTPVATYDPT